MVILLVSHLFCPNLVSLCLVCHCHFCPLVTFSLVFCLPLSSLRPLAMSAFVSLFSTCPSLSSAYLFFESLVLSVVFYLSFYLSLGHSFLDDSGDPSGSWRCPLENLSWGLDRSSTGVLSLGLEWWLHLRTCLRAADGAGRVHLCVGLWRCANTGPGVPPVSVITFFLLTLPTMVSIGCDILIK